MLRSVLVAGGACSAFFLTAAAAAQTSPQELYARIQHADGIKTSDHKEFTRILEGLDRDSPRMTPEQRLHLDYLDAWQIAYGGDYAKASPLLDAVIDHSDDVTLRFRASVTAVNILAIETRYEQAYSRLAQLLDWLPRIRDPDARQQGLIVAGLLYNQVGQYDLTLNYADKVVTENWLGKGVCKGTELKLEAWFKAKRIEEFDRAFQSGIDSCTNTGEPIWTNLIRSFAAKLDIARGSPQEAVTRLLEGYEVTLATHYPPLISTVDATLAQAYQKLGDLPHAKQYAQHAIDNGIKGQFTEAQASAYEVLYEIAKSSGEVAAALDWHEKYAVADKGYLNDTSARALAYQMVKQQVQEKKEQLDVLNKQNQVLQLEKQVTAKTTEAGKLLLLLLATVLGSIAMYAYRTKRSQLKFQKLARRDGLTDIYNRQYFVEASEQELKYCEKSMRDASVVAIDLDHFKLINDTHGHAAGDFALKRAVAMCQRHMRSVDVFGRLGGEEFGILMPDCVPERAADQAELMRKAIESLIESEEGPKFPVRASFGISAARWAGYELRQLLALADSALYQAKREGRNRVVVYSEASPVASQVPLPVAPDRRLTETFATREDVRR